jgi:PAS domain S-box-containing protein
MNFDQVRSTLVQARGRAPDDGMEKLQFELEVHQVELEMQNRELAAAQAELESSRDAYAQLYDFAPVACLTLDAMGVIQELNLAAAGLLGRERDWLVGYSLLSFVAGTDRGRLQEHLIRCLTGTESTRQEVTLCVNGRTFPVQLCSAPRRCGHEAKPLILAAIIDLAPAADVLEPAKNGEARQGQRLSEREEEVVRLIAWGYSNKEIAARLSLSVKTVETYKARSLEKLGLSTRAELVRHALLRGWLKNI